MNYCAQCGFRFKVVASKKQKHDYFRTMTQITHCPNCAALISEGFSEDAIKTRFLLRCDSYGSVTLEDTQLRHRFCTPDGDGHHFTVALAKMKEHDDILLIVRRKEAGA